MHACLGRRRLQLNPLFNSLLWPVALAMRSSVLVDGVRPPFSKALHILLSGFEFRGEFGFVAAPPWFGPQEWPRRFVRSGRAVFLAATPSRTAEPMTPLNCLFVAGED